MTTIETTNNIPTAIKIFFFVISLSFPNCLQRLRI
jgi:hypothetical protein